MVRSTTALERFLQRGLPHLGRARIDRLVRQLTEASIRYDERSSARSEWGKGERARVVPTDFLRGPIGSARKQLGLIAEQAKSSQATLHKIQPHLQRPLAGLLSLLNRLETLARQELTALPATGRPNDFARDEWIAEVATLYERAFKKDAKVSGSHSSRTAVRGPFFDLLELSKPQHLRALDPRTIKRSLSKRAGVVDR